MNWRLAAGAIGALSTLVVAQPVAAVSTQPGFQAQQVFAGLDRPVAVSFAPDGRAFVAEKGGRLKVFPRVPAVGEAAIQASSAPTFVDLSASVHDEWDRGPLGVAASPSWPTDRRVYVLYTRDARHGLIGGWGDGCPTPPGRPRMGASSTPALPA